MNLRDCELDLAILLQAAGLGTLAAPEPNLFAGPYPASAPDAFIACRHSGAEKPEKYLADTGLVLHRETVTVLVRGTRAPDGYTESGARARAAWSALYDLQPGEYVRVDPEDGAPSFLGWDEEQRPRWSFTVGLEYLSATAPGVVVPLSRQSTLQADGLSVTGGATVGRLYVVGAAPGAVAIGIPGGSRLALNAAGDRYLHLSSNVIRSNTAFAAPSVTAGQGIGNESDAFAVDGSSNFVVTRNGRLKRLSGDTTATAGNALSNTWRGRAKVAAGQASVTITNNLCLATSDVFAHVQQAAADASGAVVARTSAAAGSLTIYLSTPAFADVVVAWEIRD